MPPPYGGGGITIAKAANAHSRYTSRQFLEKERFSFFLKRSSKMRDNVSFSVTIISLGNLVLLAFSSPIKRNAQANSQIW